MKTTAALIPTLRDTPADAEVMSHRLMLRAGMIRKVAAGIYTYLPLAWRTLRKVEAIVREEMDRAGAQEIRMPAVQPAKLWEETGRWGIYGKELLRFKDRHGRAFCMGPTHEEVVTDLVRGEVRSYRQLPLNLYQIQTKFRDEIRPRFGLMRGREFIMKDGYSFDADLAGATATYDAMNAAYHRIFARLGLNFRAVEADSGQIGGQFSHEFMVLADSGEDDVVYCTTCEYAANSERAEARVAAPEKRDTPAMQSVETPGVSQVTEVADHLGTTPDRLIKTLVMQAVDGDGTAQTLAVLIRGDRTLNEVKLANHLGVPEVRMASDTEVARVTNGAVGFSGPVGLTDIPMVSDRSVAELTDAVAGANAVDTHLTHVLPGRDFALDDVADLDTAQAGDGCTRCADGVLAVRRGIEVGHIFMLGTKYTESMGAVFLDAEGKKKPFEMGCYGIGIGRSAAAAVEQHHDDRGIMWPMAIAPYQVALVAMNMKSEALCGAAESMYRQMQSAGIEVLYDNRPDRAGVKLTDMELIGIPIVVVMGDRGLERGICEVRLRSGGDAVDVPLAEAVERLGAMIRDALETPTLATPVATADT